MCTFDTGNSGDLEVYITILMSTQDISFKKISAN